MLTLTLMACMQAHPVLMVERGEPSGWRYRAALVWAW